MLGPDPLSKTHRSDPDPKEVGKERRKDPTRDFRKVYSREDRDDEEHPKTKENVDSKKTEKEIKSPKKNLTNAPSVFEISTEKGTEKDMSLTKGPLPDTEAEIVAIPSEASHQSLFGLAANTKSLDKNQKKQNRSEVAFTQEQPDISYVNPTPTTTPSQAIQQTNTTAPYAEIRPQILELVERIAGSLAVMQNQGQTDTIVTLNYPPIFKGAQLVITNFDTAKKDFNLAFEGLTQPAKEILDLQSHREILLQQLEMKGYTVHIFTTTTIVEHTPLQLANETKYARDNREGEEQPNQNKEKQKKREQ